MSFFNISYPLRISMRNAMLIMKETAPCCKVWQGQNVRSENVHSAQRERKMEIKDIYKVALNGGDIGEIVDQMAEYVEHSLVVTDKGFRVLAYSQSYPVTDPIWKKIVKKGFCSYEFVQAVKNLVPEYERIDSDEVFEVECSQSEEQKLVSALLHEGHLLGYLILLDNRNPVKTGQAEILPEFSEIIVQVLKHSPGFHRLFGDVLETAMRELIETEDVERAAERLAASGFRFPKELYCITFFLRDPKKTNAEFVMHAIRESYPGILCIEVEGRIYGVTVHLEPEKRETIPAPLDRLVERIGIGPVAENVAESLKGLKLAARTCEILRQLKWKERVCCYKSVSFYNILMSCKEPDILCYNLHPALRILNEFDLKNEGGLLETLQRFLENDCSVANTAGELYIHRNTLNYRLGKIKELTGIDYHNAQEKFRLMCSYRIWEILSSEEESQ